MDGKQEYIIGFMFNELMTQVLLIKKEHGPKCVVGRWNGIGGHQEDETPIQGQVREFFEETGVKTTEDEWRPFTKLQGEDFIVHCFWGRSNRAMRQAKTVTEEEVRVFLTNRAGLHNLMRPLAPNLHWMIPFLMDRSTKNYLCVVLANYLKDDNLDPDSTPAI